MDVILLLARLALAVVFLGAGLAKLVDRGGAHEALRDFGLPAVLARPLGILLPLAECAVGLALVPLTSAWWGALGAFALLALFSAAIALALARGRTPECHCFGQLHAAPISPSTLLRNLLLAAMAGLVLWRGRPGPSAVGWLGALTAAQWIVLLGGVTVVGLLAVEGWVVLQLMRQNGRLLARLQTLETRLVDAAVLPRSAIEVAPDPADAGLPIGTPAPPFALRDLDGQTRTLDMVRAAGKPVVLLFTDAHCQACAALLPDVGRWQRTFASVLTLTVIGRGSVASTRAELDRHNVTDALMQRRREVMRAYQAPGTPAAVLVQPDGTIGSALALGAEQIRALVARTIGQVIPRPQDTLAAGAMDSPGRAEAGTPPQRGLGPQIGAPAPEVQLPDLAGRSTRLADFRGHPVLLLFWNPDCGFCRQMLADLHAWERTPPPDALQLLVISTGSAEANQALGLRAPVVLDHDDTARRHYGVLGTPMAVLVDASGMVASDLAAGAPAILALLGRAQLTYT